jgi:hypothetical protein
VSRLSRQCGILNISQPYRPPRPVKGIALLFFFRELTLLQRADISTFRRGMLKAARLYIRGQQPEMSTRLHRARSSLSSHSTAAELDTFPYFCGREGSMKSTVFWDITPYILPKVNRRFRGTYRLHLQSGSISRARNQRESRWQDVGHMFFRNSVDFKRTTRDYTSEDKNLYNHRCQNPKSYFEIR